MDTGLRRIFFRTSGLAGLFRSGPADFAPWSSVSMHPVEHLLYWSGSLIHLIRPLLPLPAMYHLNIAVTGAIVGHLGFDRIVTSATSAFDTAYAHNLHHKYFEVNHADGMMPLDRMMGTWHDGRPEGDRAMQERFRKKKERLKAGNNNTWAD
jgi:sterol desaturase/sphingolipid hydroxylase (fatty acid hydroxylase superfamily)